MEPRKQAIIDALSRFLRQRPGLEFGNYGDVKTYRAEMRSIAKDKREAETLLAAVSWRDGITADVLVGACSDAFSGRLAILERPDGTYRVEYCTGQYWPTEYRKAVAAVLASALWTYTREKAMPTSEHKKRVSPHGDAQVWSEATGWISPGDWLRAHFRKEFGRGIASRWFS